jgi:catechol 2,3-dioxygenase-like lactoylglutathione lyase family enzyme
LIGRDSGELDLSRGITYVSLLVHDYDEALEFYVQKLNFELIEDTALPEEGKRWVVIAPKDSKGAAVLLARAANEEQGRFVGNQTGGRVFLFLHTNDFDSDYRQMLEHGIEFVRGPDNMEYGKVAVFKDLYGNLWDLLQLRAGHPNAERLV